MSYTKHNFKSGDILLSSQLNEMDAQIELNSNKQDAIEDLSEIRNNASSALKEHQTIKTLNGESLVGEGNIEISVDGMTDTQ